MGKQAKEILQGTRTGGEIPRDELTAIENERHDYGFTVIDLEEFNEDLAAVLIEKTEGTLHVKVNTICERANVERKNDGGLRAYCEISTRFTRTTGLKLSQRMKWLMTPHKRRIRRCSEPKRSFFAKHFLKFRRGICYCQCRCHCS